MIANSIQELLNTMNQLKWALAAALCIIDVFAVNHVSVDPTTNSFTYNSKPVFLSGVNQVVNTLYHTQLALDLLSRNQFTASSSRILNSLKNVFGKLAKQFLSPSAMGAR